MLMKANKAMLAYIGTKPGTNNHHDRDSDSWFTPTFYTDLVHEVMGGIDLDPFSSKKANAHVRAKRYFDVDGNAFKKVWFRKPGRVFMNPPYSRKLIEASIEIFLENWNNNSISEAIVLVNNATETKWFQSLLRTSNSICLPEKRISFKAVDGKHVSGNTRGQVFLYFGQQYSKFEKVFKRIGVVLRPMRTRN